MSDPASPAPSRSPRPWRARRVATGEGDLHVRIRGRGPTLLCLHGLTAHGGVWDAVAPRLEGRFRLCVPDLLSRGRSDVRPDLAYRLEAELRRLGRLRRAIPEGPYLLLGHSHGAALGVALAAHPGILPPGPAGLVLVAPVTPGTSRPPILELLRARPLRRALAPLAVRLRGPLTRWVLERRAFGDPSRVDDATVRRYAAPYGDARRAEALLRILADWRPAELSAHVPDEVPPASVVAGARDARVPPGEARRWARRLEAGFRMAPGAGHMVPEERPDLVVEAVLGVAGRRPGPTGDR